MGRNITLLSVMKMACESEYFFDKKAAFSLCALRSGDPSSAQHTHLVPNCIGVGTLDVQLQLQQDPARNLQHLDVGEGWGLGVGGIRSSGRLNGIRWWTDF